MHIAAQIGPFAAMHQADLGVGLEINEPINDLNARPLQFARPANIGLFIETRLQFDQGGHVLAGLRRLDQRLHNR